MAGRLGKGKGGVNEGEASRQWMSGEMGREAGPGQGETR
jgi:hypothetical protein